MTTKPMLFAGISSFAHMRSTDARHGWQRPGPVFEAEGHNPGESEIKPEVKPGEEKPKPGEEKPKPSDAEARLLREVMTLKNKLETATAESKKFEGIDPEQVRSMLAERETQRVAAEDAETERMRKAGEFDALLTATKNANAKDLAAANKLREDEVKKVEALNKTVRELTVGNAFAISNFLREDTVLTPTKARRIYEGHFDVVDGVITPFNKERGENGREPLVDGSGSALSFDVAMKSIIEADAEKDQILKTKAKSGSGTSPSAGKPGAGKENERPTTLSILTQGLSTLQKAK